MTKKEYLTEAIRAAGVKGNIYTKLKDMMYDNGIHFAGLLRSTDTAERAKSRKKYEEEGSTMVRRKYYNVATVYNIVLVDVDEEHLEVLLENLLVSLGPGFDDGDGNWVSIEAGEADWVDEHDSLLKAKLAVELPVTCRYGIYRDMSADMPKIEIDKEWS